jgi:phage terminase Nu1 subunit (DNA packaging protein)
MKSDEGVNIETITKLLNIGRRHFYGLKLLAGTPPDVSRGRYNASTWVLWYVRFLSAELERRGSPGGPESGAMQAERLKLISAQVQRIEMENAVARGDLLELDEVRDAMTRKLINCKSRLRAIPSGLGPTLVNTSGAECAKRLAVAIDQALTELDGDVTGRTLPLEQHH